MRDADQAERTGQAVGGVETDRARAERLKEIIAEHGWPTIDFVGRDAASAAWLIAQHADFDVAFQERALELMREALADDQVDPVDVAYLKDRVAVNRGRPQTYGTQILCMDGRPGPATPIEDAENVDARRNEVGLDPLEDYYVELEEACAAEAASP